MDWRSTSAKNWGMRLSSCGTTMDPERRTLLSVKLEDIAECETIFTTLMGEDVESRRKFIEENALDVKNLDI
jgi:DNA gyrase subunit B